MRPWIVKTRGSRPDLWTAMERWAAASSSGVNSTWGAYNFLDSLI
jgi:hypothetical protein